MIRAKCTFMIYTRWQSVCFESFVVNSKSAVKGFYGIKIIRHKLYNI